MAGRLTRLNGWRRLWLVATAALAIWFVVLWPVQALKDQETGRNSYDRAIEQDFASGQCRTYQTGPLERLPEPGFNDGCWHIYTSRKYDAAVPYTLEAYRNNNSAKAREHYLTALGMGVAGTAIVSGLVYFFGWLIGWIFAGFRPQH
ncbi:hypothetical protein [Bradyrhizobium sp. AUGA SZCCT0431]|uniref:hypothetical protein n=1 Tax=Bradyrhizobium sp. AUGA SZCCT0431 TaxID=2807674 RepID=UPI001BADA7C7|nr:hypothetical protein [Bradyrhizobium sp. AUGA SZCCT0431]MBR1143681.1 hypothetical protein [Bradyrhizobium sp. AUGA SZCCT0431]